MNACDDMTDDKKYFDHYYYYHTDKKFLPRVKVGIRSYLIKKKVTTYFDVIE